MHIWSLLALIIFLCGGSQAIADTDEGLYAPKAPDGSAFVRFLSVDNANFKITSSGKKNEIVEGNSVTPYYPMIAGNFVPDTSVGKLEAVLESEKFYTVAYINNEFVTIEDTKNTDRSKATVSLYNLSDIGTVDLKAKESSILVIDSVEPFTQRSRDLNPVKIDFTIFKKHSSDWMENTVLDEIILERGNHYSVFYTDVSAFITKSEIDTTR